MLSSFSLCRTPQIEFGPGAVDSLGRVVARFGRSTLLVTGASSLRDSGATDRIETALLDAGVRSVRYPVSGEPSPDIVDSGAFLARQERVETICAVGGGSVIDAGKAISAMVPVDGSVADYLEGVGSAVHPGVKIPFVAAPTTAGTGSEATRNAVISAVGLDGYKRSLRHDNLVPNAAVVDPMLSASCPARLAAACGMDAFTQLLESYVSPAASPVTDALAYAGLAEAARCLVAACTTGVADPDMRAGMSYAALISGITLANAGLGIVHALASTIGGRYAIAHGVVCGTLLAPATRVTIGALQARAPDHPSLVKYACVGALVSGRYSADRAESCRLLVDTIDQWTAALGIPALGEYGITQGDAERIAGATNGKRNCVELTAGELTAIVRERAGARRTGDTPIGTGS